MRIRSRSLVTALGVVPLCALAVATLGIDPALAQQPAPKPAKPPAAAPPAAEPPAVQPPAAPADDAKPPKPAAKPEDAPPADPKKPEAPGTDSPPAGTKDGAGSSGAGAAGAGADAPLIPPGGTPPTGAPPPQPPAKPKTAAAGAASGAGATGAEAKVDPTKDEKELKEQGERRPTAGGEVGAAPSDVYAEDWWSQARPVFEFHGYYRVRAELFHNFALGRRDTPNSVIWPQPADNDYVSIQGQRTRVELCGDDPVNPEPCDNNTQAGANMRFRINPELHISDNLRVMAQVDMLDNVVLGSTPQGYVNQPSDTGGYTVAARGGYSALGAFSSTQYAPSAGSNSQNDSIQVKRAWGEYRTPVGLLRFGRMPSHWGLGMFVNSGDGFDSDYGSTADRIMFITGIPDYDLYFAGAWDFANEGPSVVTVNDREGQPYDAAQLDDVSQYVLVVVRRRNPELQKLELAKGEVVLNGGAYAVYRNQVLDSVGADASIGAPQQTISDSYVRRGMEVVIPDLWFQFLYKKFRFEAEAALIYGSMENTNRVPGSGTDYINPADPDDPGWDIRQFGLATETSIRAVEDRLKVGFGFGYATGDPDVDALNPPVEGLQPQLTADRNFSTFRFHPDYRIDLILWRNILNRVQGAYYFRPSVSYDFNREKNGQRIGGGAAFIWSRASHFVQAPGNARDLGIELNFQLYYQAKDGTLNDDPDKMGGFYTSLQYGVMFPLGGLDYLPLEEQEFPTNDPFESETAQTLRWFLGILF